MNNRIRAFLARQFSGDLNPSCPVPVQAFPQSGYDRLRPFAIAILLTILMAGCIATLRPFLSCLVLAMIFCLATWPAFLWMRRRFNCGPTVAAAVMTLFLALFFLIPLLFLGSSLAQNSSALLQKAFELFREHSGAPPIWLKDFPLVGPYIERGWSNHIADTGQLTENLQQFSVPASRWLLKTGATFGQGILDVAIAILISFFFFRYGENASVRISTLAARLIGTQGPYLLTVTKNTLIGIVYGMLGMALAQGTVAAIGFTIAGLPAATVLGFITFILSFTAIGPLLIWIPATIWLLAQGQIGMGIFMGLWGFFVISSIDNVVRPYFISVSSHLPILLVLLGIFGGMLAFGFIGLFLGPTFLALAYTLFLEWSASDNKISQGPASE